VLLLPQQLQAQMLINKLIRFQEEMFQPQYRKHLKLPNNHFRAWQVMDHPGLVQYHNMRVYKKQSQHKMLK